MPTIKRALLALVAPLLALATIDAGEAHADVEIRFDLSQSQFSALDDLIQLSPGSRAGGAYARIIVPGDQFGVRNGDAYIEELSLGRVAVEETPLGLFTLTAHAQALQLGAAAGQLVDLDTIFVPAEKPASLFIEGGLDCRPAEYCDSVASFPIDLTGTQHFAPLLISLQDLEREGRATLSGRVELDLAGQTAFVDLVGREVGRVVPEPGLASMLLAGLFGLTFVHRHAARRRGVRF